MSAKRPALGLRGHEPPGPWRSGFAAMSRRRPRLAAALAVALILGGAGASPAMAAGTVDTTFGGGGLAVSPFGPGARASAVALAPDGRIVVAGVAPAGRAR
jgi:hypothetical protein